MSHDRKMLCAIEPNEEARAIVQKAAHIAARDDAALILMHIVPTMWHPYLDVNMTVVTEAQVSIEREAIKEATRKLAELAETVGIPSDQVIVKSGHAVNEIIECAEELSCSLIIMGVHNRSGLKRLLGSTAHGVLNGTDKSILLVHANDLPVEPYHNVMVAVDTSNDLPTVLAGAKPFIAQARSYETVSVVQSIVAHMGALPPTAFASSWPIADMQANLVKAVKLTVRESCEAIGLCTRNLKIVEGDPAHEICKRATKERMELIVMGSGKRSVVDRILVGSTAHGVLNNTPCDVLIAR